jgi:hydrogenase-4 component H
MFLSKLKEAKICFKAGRVTIRYPFVPHDPAPNFRGKPATDIEKCIGCGGCANVCPARAIEITDPCQERRVLVYHLVRCTYCGRCAEVCPQEAVRMTQDFETATNNPDDLIVRNTVFMGTCQRCGRCFEPESPLDKMQVHGLRPDGGKPCV